MANTVALVEDAALLASHDSPGRAQSLIVLAMEELAKARWLYETAEFQWSNPLGLYGLEPRPAGDVMVPEGLSSTRQPHAEKLQVAEQFAAGLAGFWSLERRMEYYERPDLETFMATARQRNLDKQAGFYVDRSSEQVASGHARKFVGGSGPGGGVGEVEAAGGVEGVFGGAAHQAGGQERFVVVVVAGAVDREAPVAG